MSTYHARLAQVLQRDPRYVYEAYEFVFAALSHTQKLLGRVPAEDSSNPGAQYHVSGRELVHGVRDLAVREFGLMARVVFRLWGINRTADIGNIVFNLVEENLMSKSDQDSLADFQDLFDLDQALVQEFQIELDEAEWRR
ncbi:MAG TPA: Minf_1886 family protein [Gemmataceae bacterium]|nr:Minf_1886 family protein [Gemmataceae bacterium]